jgi:hypothetical protein
MRQGIDADSPLLPGELLSPVSSSEFGAEPLSPGSLAYLQSVKVHLRTPAPALPPSPTPLHSRLPKNMQLTPLVTCRIQLCSPSSPPDINMHLCLQFCDHIIIKIYLSGHLYTHLPTCLIIHISIHTCMYMHVSMYRTGCCPLSEVTAFTLSVLGRALDHLNDSMVELDTWNQPHCEGVFLGRELLHS